MVKFNPIFISNISSYVGWPWLSLTLSLLRNISSYVGWQWLSLTLSLLAIFLVMLGGRG